MSDEKVEVKLGAQVDPLKGDMNDAAQSVQASLAKIADALQNFGQKNKETTERAIKNNADLSRSFIELKGSISQGYDVIAGVVERVRGVVGALGAVLAGGMLGKEAVHAVLDEAAAVRSLQIAFGETAEKASLLNTSLQLAGISSETYISTAMHVGRVLKTQSEEFDRLKIQYKDTAGALLPMDEILRNVYTRMQDFKAGTDQNLFALTAVGRGAKDFASEMQRLGSVQERAIQLQHELGIEMGPEQQAKVEAYRVEMNAFRITLEQIGQHVGEAMLPRLEKLAAWFNSNGPAAIEVIMKALQGLATVLELIGLSFSVTATIGMAAMKTIGTAAVSAGQAFVLAKDGQFSEAWNALKTGFKTIADTAVESFDTIVNKSRAAYNDIHGLWAGPEKWSFMSVTKSSIPGSGKESFGFKPTKGGEADDMAGWDNILKAAENGFNNMKLQQGSFEVWSVEMTRDYWAQVLSMGNLSAKDRMNIENKFYDAERKVQQDAFNAEIAGLEAQKAAYKYNSDARIAIAEEEYRKIAERYGAQSAIAIAAFAKVTEEYQRAADQRARIADIERRQQEATAQFIFNTQKNALTQQLALRQINVQQSLALEQQYLDQKLAMDLASINAEIAASPDNPIKLAELNSKKLALTQQYELAKTQIVNQAELDRKQFAIQAAADIEAAAGSLFSNLATSSGKWMDVLNNGLKQLNQQLAQLAGQALAKQLLGAGTSGGDFISKITGGIFGGGAGAAGKTAEQTAEAAHTTAVTADTTATTGLTATTTTLASTSTTLVGIFTALATSAETASVALAAMGAGGGFKPGGGGILQDILGGFGDIPMFAAGTPYVPQDTLAVVHRGEAIVPRAYNRGNQGSSYSTNNHFFVAGPIDTRSRSQIEASAFEGTRRGVFKNK